MLAFDEQTTRLLETAYRGSDVSRRRRMAFDALSLSAGDTVVDIGCGNGMLTEEMPRAVGPTGCVVGIDPSADMRAPLGSLRGFLDRPDRRRISRQAAISGQ